MDLSGQTQSYRNLQVNVSGPHVATRKPRCMLMDLQGHNLLQYNQLMSSKLLGVRSGTPTLHDSILLSTNALRSSGYNHLARGAMAVNHRTSQTHYIECPTRYSFVRHLVFHLLHVVLAIWPHLAALAREQAPTTHSRAAHMSPKA